MIKRAIRKTRWGRLLLWRRRREAAAFARSRLERLRRLESGGLEEFGAGVIDPQEGWFFRVAPGSRAEWWEYAEADEQGWHNATVYADQNLPYDETPPSSIQWQGSGREPTPAEYARIKTRLARAQQFRF
jgi:hypothetical protein